MTPSPGTIRRNPSTISARRASTVSSGVGIRIVSAPPRGEHLGGPKTRAQTKTAPRRARPVPAMRSRSALARLEARVGLVDDVNATLPPHDPAVLVALLQRLERIGDLHRRNSASF